MRHSAPILDNKDTWPKPSMLAAILAALHVHVAATKRTRVEARFHMHVPLPAPNG